VTTETTITLGAHKIQRLTLNQSLIAPNSHKNPTWYNQQGMSGPGGKKPLAISLSFFSPNKQKTEHQSESTL
jgi:hypothetical protein